MPLSQRVPITTVVLLAALAFGMQTLIGMQPTASSACEQVCISKCDPSLQDCTYKCDQYCAELMQKGSKADPVEDQAFAGEQHFLKSVGCWLACATKKLFSYFGGEHSGACEWGDKC